MSSFDDLDQQIQTQYETIDRLQQDIWVKIEDLKKPKLDLQQEVQDENIEQNEPQIDLGYDLRERARRLRWEKQVLRNLRDNNVSLVERLNGSRQAKAIYSQGGYYEEADINYLTNEDTSRRESIVFVQRQLLGKGQHGGVFETKSYDFVERKRASSEDFIEVMLSKGRSRVVKVIQRKQGADDAAFEKEIRDFHKEYSILRKLDHLNFLPSVFGKFQDKQTDTYKMLMSKVEGYNSEDILNYVSSDPIKSFQFLKSLFDNIITLHSKNVTHGDLHWGNIMFNNEGGANFIDFGAAADFDNLDIDNQKLFKIFIKRFEDADDESDWPSLYEKYREKRMQFKRNADFKALNVFFVQPLVTSLLKRRLKDNALKAFQLIFEIGLRIEKYSSLLDVDLGNQIKNLLQSADFGQLVIPENYKEETSSTPYSMAEHHAKEIISKGFKINIVTRLDQIKDYDLTIYEKIYLARALELPNGFPLSNYRFLKISAEAAEEKASQGGVQDIKKVENLAAMLDPDNFNNEASHIQNKRRNINKSLKQESFDSIESTDSFFNLGKQKDDEALDKTLVGIGAPKNLEAAVSKPKIEGGHKGAVLYTKSGHIIKYMEKHELHAYAALVNEFQNTKVAPLILGFPSEDDIIYNYPPSKYAKFWNKKYSLPRKYSCVPKQDNRVIEYRKTMYDILGEDTKKPFLFLNEDGEVAVVMTSALAGIVDGKMLDIKAGRFISSPTELVEKGFKSSWKKALKKHNNMVGYQIAEGSLTNDYSAKRGWHAIKKGKRFDKEDKKFKKVPGYSKIAKRYNAQHSEALVEKHLKQGKDYISPPILEGIITSLRNILTKMESTDAPVFIGSSILLIVGRTPDGVPMGRAMLIDFAHTSDEKTLSKTQLVNRKGVPIIWDTRWFIKEKSRIKLMSKYSGKNAKPFTYEDYKIAKLLGRLEGHAESQNIMNEIAENPESFIEFNFYRQNFIEGTQSLLAFVKKLQPQEIVENPIYGKKSLTVDDFEPSIKTNYIEETSS